MQTLFDFLPIVLFFVFYKIFGIYIATASAMLVSLIQVITYRIRHQKFETMQLISMSMILILGGLTLIFRNPWFIKWKPTVIYWLSSVVFLFSSLFRSKPLIQKLMESNIQLPAPIWKKLNLLWVLFFFIMGIANIYVAYNFNTDTWVNFKLFGGTGCLIIFVFFQTLFLTKHQLRSSKTNSS